MSNSAESPMQSPMQSHIHAHIQAHGGWIAFDDFMAHALYAPNLGYYSKGNPIFGAMPHKDGSDFVTAPEISPLFGQTVARQIAQALAATGTDEIWEFGAGTGALALQILDALDAMGIAVRRYTIVDLSHPLKERQRETLKTHAARLEWVSALPETIHGVVVGNELLDAMPVKLLARVNGVWNERGVAIYENNLMFADKKTDLRPPLEISGNHDYLTEIHPQAEAFMRTLAEHLGKGAIFLLDYGFPEAEFYHEQRITGTLMCHRAHKMDDNPLEYVGEKDITAHINFTGIALAGQDSGLEVLGYTNQAYFLLNCGFADALQAASRTERVAAQKLIFEHEMGEFFKVIGFTKGDYWEAMGFTQGDKTHRL